MRRGWVQIGCLVGTSIVGTAFPAFGQDSALGPIELRAAEGSSESASAPASATAQPSLLPEAEDEARSRFELGESLYRQGRFEEALAEFERAHQLTRRPTFYYNIYLCHRDAGHPRQAVGALRRYLEESDAVENRGLLERRLQSLEAQIAAEEQARRSAVAAEYRATAAESARAHSAPVSRVGPFVTLAVGGAMLVTAGGVGLSLLSVRNELEDECWGSACPSWEHDQIDALRRRSITFDVLAATGGALTLGGLVWLLASRPHALRDERSSGSARFHFGCGATGCQVRGAF